MSFPTRILNLVFLLPLLLTGVSAQLVALSDFQPAAMNLSPACNVTYTTTIPNCNSIDFTGGVCSGPCIASLVQISYRVYLECSTVPTDNRLLVARFLAGQGISTLCPNVVVETLSGSAGATTSTSSMASSTSVRLIYDTSSVPVVAPSTTSTTTQMLNWPTSPQTSGSSSSKEITTTQVIQITMTRTFLSTITLASATLSFSSFSSVTSTSSSTHPKTTTTTLVASFTSAVSAINTSTAMVISVVSSSTYLPLSSFSVTESVTIIVTAVSAVVSATTSAASARNAGPSSNCGRYGGSPFDYCNSGHSLLSTENAMLSIALACIIGILIWL